MESRNEILGIFLVLGIAACFAMANTLAGLAYTGGADALSVSTSRFLLPALILLAILAVRARPILMPKRDALTSIALGLVTAVYTWLLLSSIELLPVPLAVLIFYLFPLFTTFIVSALGWEKLYRVNIIAAIVAFAGLTLVLGVSGEGLHMQGVFYAVLAAIGLATVSAVSKRVIRTGDPRQATLYMAATATVAFLLVTLTSGEFHLPTTEPGWWGFVGTNIFYAVAMIGYFVAISLIGPAKTTLFSYLEPLVATAAAWILLDQTLEPLQFVGIAIVIGALIAAARAGLRAGQAKA